MEELETTDSCVQCEEQNPKSHSTKKYPSRGPTSALIRWGSAFSFSSTKWMWENGAATVAWRSNSTNLQKSRRPLLIPSAQESSAGICNKQRGLGGGGGELCATEILSAQGGLDQKKQQPSGRFHRSSSWLSCGPQCLMSGGWIKAASSSRSHSKEEGWLRSSARPWEMFERARCLHCALHWSKGHHTAAELFHVLLSAASGEENKRFKWLILSWLDMRRNN